MSKNIEAIGWPVQQQKKMHVTTVYTAEANNALLWKYTELSNSAFLVYTCVLHNQNKRFPLLIKWSVRLQVDVLHIPDSHSAKTFC